MQKRLIKTSLFLIFAIVILFSKSSKVIAIEDPLNSQNNIFGIHVIDENDLEAAASLVNSSGGDWGYVTFVIRDDERNNERWQKIFNKLRKYHLIPIIRIATRQENDNWAKPKVEDIGNWVDFFNSLDWVVSNRYVVIGNEPNHAAEWGGTLSPEEYATYLKAVSSELKAASDDYFILPAGFDTSAPNNKIHMSEFLFLKRMQNKEPGIFNYIDGWTSHSYPNPDFSGSVNSVGAGSIKSYRWELDLLKKLNVIKNLPVFITETGWAHNTETETKYAQPSNVSQNYIKAFEIWNNDGQIAAVTPFLLNYQGAPFDKFSWKDPRGNFYSFYEDVQKILKREGKPVQKDIGEIKTVLFPQFIDKNDKIYGVAIIENKGQVIWERGNNYSVNTGAGSLVEVDSPLFFDIEPGHSGIALYREIK